ncbi:MAG: radical SAM protein [Ruminococcus sp.]|nr:radical SAM protein [Ruminococcus sp.]
MDLNAYKSCRLCPRKCGIDRTSAKGRCGMGAAPVVAKASLHMWEEPCISYKNGAGTVFFSGCSLHCCFCQNNVISNELFGRELTPARLADVFISLQDRGADNIDLVTPTHFVPDIICALDMVRHKLSIPVVYNTSGYELPETIAALDGYIDVYMPDIKYFSSEAASRYSNAPNYFEYASAAVKAMTEQVGELRYNEDGGLVRGTIIRHLVMPGLRHDSMKILDWIAENIFPERALVSIMNQYTPFGHIPADMSEINRRVTKMEYNSVVRHAQGLGIKGFTQENSSAGTEYVPDFDLSGI